MAVSSKELVGASTQLLILCTLAREPNYGYELVRRINELADGVFEWREGTIYPVLHRLEKEKLIRSQWQDAPSRRQRKYYYLTAAGRAAMSEDVKQWGAFSELVQRFASGVAHG
jgi:DNA-binding PadR family transcriptional regulator